MSEQVKRFLKSYEKLRKYCRVRFLIRQPIKGDCKISITQIENGVSKRIIHITDEDINVCYQRAEREIERYVELKYGQIYKEA